MIKTPVSDAVASHFANPPARIIPQGTLPAPVVVPGSLIRRSLKQKGHPQGLPSLKPIVWKK